ncbi:glutathione S-transferase N-terminal domain-containing protein [Methylonatrum kenyense]|uniref:glutathione binding-like protein n=1 Tax=Methylonatrum kenyense TaxID=455253 RepID=UPI0020BEA75B|nr:glutathione binding-like protein [Methylonatrum kenyense]MCK8515984.1 glutathione S-transferase N-terminal domain-containing protein [Methylonatrum kenyense]
MIDLYYWPTPNGHKASIMLEESGLDYRVHPINILKGDQFSPEFLEISPNNRIPAIVDQTGPNGDAFPIFESGAILMYLAEKSGCLLPETPAERFQVLQWLFFQVGNVGPMFGQCGHFLGYAPEPVPYAMKRYQDETRRLYGVMDGVLGERPYLAGDSYSIADVATYPWLMPRVRQLHEMTIEDFPRLHDWVTRIAARPAVQRGSAVLADVMKIGDPTDEAREALFGQRQMDRR